MARGTVAGEADLIVVGGSVGGLAAAVIAADRGARCCVLERARSSAVARPPRPETIAAAGSRFQREAGIDDDPGTLAEDIAGRGRRSLDRELAGAVAEQGASLVAWLADRCGTTMESCCASRGAGHSSPAPAHARRPGRREPGRRPRRAPPPGTRT